ncbi:MAG: hypothetical protein IJ180_11295 [Bacteroidales bacterium]|nr:hypothetical protein [Bacteroidales bacterium]MBQ9255341.1 hypothetical protein [Bacteroidales bacterium]
MSAEEMSNVFDIRFNSYVNQHNYGNQQGDTDFTCDEYEKSLFLTQAQNELVKFLYTGKNHTTVPSINYFQNHFEDSEENRRVLSNLICSYETNAPFTTSYNINLLPKLVSDMQTVCVQLPKDLLYITTESVELKERDGACVPNHFVDVVPITQDQLNKVIRNPFRGPNKYRVLRLDLATDIVELVSSYSISTYFCRYLKKPSPIITAELPDEVAIDKRTNIQDCELSTSIHDAIVDVAIQLAYHAKVFGRQSTTQSNN